MLKLASLAVAATMYLAPSFAFAEDCSCTGTESDTVVTARSSLNRDLTMRFPGRPVTKAVKKAYLCVNPDAQINLVKLWMPDHGHGSAPTKLTRVDGTCTVVSNIGFSMPGKWELQISLADDDRSTLSVDVNK